MRTPAKKLPATARMWRVYFTCRAMWPHFAAIDEGTVATQQVFKRVSTAGASSFISNTDVGRRGMDMVKAGSGKIRRLQRRNKPNEPTWWIEVYGVLEVQGDGAVIRAS